MERIHTFQPHIAVILNITPDHLDRYDSFAAYREAKLKITRNQTRTDYLILNGEDPELTEPATQARVISFTRQSNPEVPFTWDGLHICFNQDPVLPYSECGLRGTHNLMNILAGLNACSPYISNKNAADFVNHADRVLREFKGIEHRLELVKERNGVRFYNDSKATNVDAVEYAIDSFSAPVILILGGYDKNGDFTQLIEVIQEHVKETIAIGSARETIYTMIGQEVPVTRLETLDEAVNLAHSIAQPGDVVLLSPACASFDQYENYEQRGEHFKRLIGELQ